MTADELRQMYLDFFAGKDHKVISGGSLIPENDPSVLFTTAGMHPLVPYLLGERHPAGKRLCNCQKCIRTGDIDDVGDVFHLTFFEMLGNWSLGDYFKEEAIAWSYEFLTSSRYLGFNPESLFVTVFAGSEKAPVDEESRRIWQQFGIPEERIFLLPETDNWWEAPGETGPCGPDTEMFIDTGRPACGPACRPGCFCGKYFEIWNDVFMQFEKQVNGAQRPLRQHNVDTGMGLERTVAMLQGQETIFETELFKPVIEVIESICTERMDKNEATAKAFRVIADHIRSSVFILGDEQGVVPANLGQGYVLRRLIRRSVRYARKIGLCVGFSKPVAECIIENYRHLYPELEQNRRRIVQELVTEEERFEKTLGRGLNTLNKTLEEMKAHGQTVLSGRLTFRLYDTYGFPLEFTEEICRERGVLVDQAGYDNAFTRHRKLSKRGADKAFKGGLGDKSEAAIRLHTATHLLHKSLKLVLGDHVRQKGSNITAERLRFDFSHTARMTDDQKRQVEDLVNKAIERDLPVTIKVVSPEEAKALGATALFTAKYGEKVKVYSIGDFSMEVCGGPHVKMTGGLGCFKIVKETASSAGVRRIKAVLD